ncbi:MAG: hypothetical protein J5482_05160 [Oscillospiraceae bacterium]|nr:hypothetical protein [Oscillospiraceae bacterium]
MKRNNSDRNSRAAAPWVKWTAIAVCLCAAAGALILLLPGGSKKPAGNPASPLNPASYAISQAIYPETAPHPTDEDWSKDSDAASAAMEAWWNETEVRQANQNVYRGALDNFLRRTVPTFLAGEKEDNRVYSPLNVYLALSMLAEITDGESRAQILDLLGAPDIEAARQRAHALWLAHHRDDGMVTSVLAASLWLRDDLAFIPETLDTLAKNYYASSYRGVMGSEELDAAMQSWLNEQTGGLLEQQASGIRLDPKTVIALATTIYFRAGWMDDFSEHATAPDVFHAAGGDVTCDYLRRENFQSTVYGGNGFTALSLPLANGGAAMWIVLPDEGAAPEELVQSGAAMEFLLADRESWQEQGVYLVRLSLPKFDVSSDTDLIDGLRALGVTDVLDEDLSDFSPLTRQADRLFLSQAQHAARVAIDEKGVTAAAFTVLAVARTALPTGEEYDFTVDRPFFFAITDDDGLPTFTGVVNCPAE